MKNLKEPQAMSSLLEVNNMTHFFGGLRAVHGFNLSIEPGRIHGLIGPNGAGKTTVFNLITGVYTPTEAPSPLKGKISGAKNPITSPQWGSAEPFRTCFSGGT